jgi:hypothetical protein
MARDMVANESSTVLAADFGVCYTYLASLQKLRMTQMPFTDENRQKGTRSQ